jgi:hypothetical protein
VAQNGVGGEAGISDTWVTIRVFWGRVFALAYYPSCPGMTGSRLGFQLSTICGKLQLTQTMESEDQVRAFDWRTVRAMSIAVAPHYASIPSLLHHKLQTGSQLS